MPSGNSRAEGAIHRLPTAGDFTFPAAAQNFRKNAVFSYRYGTNLFFACGKPRGFHVIFGDRAGRLRGDATVSRGASGCACFNRRPARP